MLASTASGDVTGAASKTIVSVIGAADRRPKIKQIIIGCTGTPTDAMARFALRRFTADGTGTANTPRTLDIGDGATPTCTSKVNYTAEPTYTAGNLAEFPLHQRATGVFEPPAGETWACPIGTANGLGVQMISATALAYNVTIVYAE